MTKSGCVGWGVAPRKGTCLIDYVPTRATPPKEKKRPRGFTQPLRLHTPAYDCAWVEKREGGSPKHQKGGICSKKGWVLKRGRVLKASPPDVPGLGSLEPPSPIRHMSWVTNYSTKKMDRPLQTTQSVPNYAEVPQSRVFFKEGPPKCFGWCHPWAGAGLQPEPNCSAAK